MFVLYADNTTAKSTQESFQWDECHNSSSFINSIWYVKIVVIIIMVYSVQKLVVPREVYPWDENK